MIIAVILYQYRFLSLPSPNFACMARILCIDYGGKRTGLAVTDPLKIIATALTTVATKDLVPYLKNYFRQEQVELILIGMPKNWDDSDTHATPLVHQAIQKLKKEFPAIPVKEVDERYTSRLASQAMIAMGMKKKQRQVKGNVDQIAAAIMLQEYLNANH
jgi:putative Holliday junction resolvase